MSCKALRYYIITQKGLIYCLKGSLNVHPSFQRLHP